MTLKHGHTIIRLEKHCLKVKNAPVNQFKVANIVLNGKDVTAV